jgi:hypothetical protein
MKTTTTFRELRAAGACTARYRYLAKALGGVRKYGQDTPISLLQIFNICGRCDLLWVIEDDDLFDQDIFDYLYHNFDLWCHTCSIKCVPHKKDANCPPLRKALKELEDDKAV